MKILSFNCKFNSDMIEHNQIVFESEFNELYENVFKHERLMTDLLKETQGHPSHKVKVHDVLLMEGTTINADPNEDEHYWYEWDVGTLQTGVFFNHSKRTIHASTFNIEECWHRQRMLVEPLVVTTFSEHENGTSKADILLLHRWNNIELNGGWFDAQDLLEDQMIVTNETTHEMVKAGLNVMNLTGFHWWPNILCRQ